MKIDCLTEWEKTTSDEDFIKFKTYYNYLSSLNLLFNEHRDNLKEISQSKKFKTLNAGNSINISEVENALKIAWLTELQLKIKQKELIPIALQWVPVQTYYAVFHSIRALLFAMNKKDPKSHRGTLKQISKIIEQKPEIFLKPIQVILKDNPQNKENLLNLPPKIKIEKVSNLICCNNEKAWSQYYLFLKTTRKKMIDPIVKQYKKDNKKGKIRKEEKEKIINSLYPTTIFDLIYRLRIRSNYLDANIFLLKGQESEKEEMYYVCQNLCNDTLQNTELIIARIIGKKKFAEIINKMNIPQNLIHNTVKKRWEINQKLF